MDNLIQIKEQAKKILKEKILDRKQILSASSEQDKKEKISGYLEGILERLLRAQKICLTKDAFEKLREQILAEILGFGSLEQLLADHLISDILVNSTSQVFIEKQGEMFKLDTQFSNTEEIRAIIERMMIGTARRIDQFSPFVDFRLEDGSRVTAIIPPVSSSPAICIRKFSKEVFEPEDLVRFKTLNTKVLKFLDICIKARLNVLVTGPTGVGKTTLLNTLVKFVPSNERMVIIEDTQELAISQDYHFLKLLTRPPNIEGKGEITLYDLVKLSLHLRPDRIIIGEVRGEETFYFLQAINTGHEGSMCTLHANSAEDALARLETLGLMAKANIQAQVIKRFLSMGIDLIVHLQRTVEGQRVVSQVSEVIFQQGDWGIRDIFLRRQKFEEGKETVEIEFTGSTPTFLDKIKARLGVGEEIFT